MATINNNSTSLESIALIGIPCEFTGAIHSPNDLWHVLKESHDVDNAKASDRFHLESFTAHMLNIDNDGQLRQKLLRADVACLSSLEASHMAVQYLRTNEGDMAVCGGVNGFLHQKVFYNIHLLVHNHLMEEVDHLVDPERDGDPIEANCLDRFFNRSNLDLPLLLGSIKSNLGHTEDAAGVASLIKVTMCMYHRGITANMQFTSLNPKIDAQTYNLHILQNFVPFPSVSNNEKIAVGVNSFETGGTTTHSIVEEYQPINKTSIQNGHIDDGNHIKSKQYFIFIFSTFRQRISQQLLLKRTISYTHSAIFVFLNRQQLQEQIKTFLTEQPLPSLSIISRPTKLLAQKICFVFSGQGPQWWSMGRQLYESEPLFNKWINLIDREMTKINNGEWRLLEELIEKKNERESRINDTNIAQPPLFAIQVALVALLVSWNIYPSSIISHSGGDQAAAFVAGRLSLKETVRIEHLVCIAVVNSPRSVIINGDEKAIDEIQQVLSISYLDVFKARLRIENAFHSYQMNRFDIEKEMLSSLKDIRGLPIHDQKQIFDPICVNAKLYSSITDDKINDNIPVDNEEANVFLEITPHPVLATSIREYSSIQRLANCIPTHPLLGIRQLNDQTSATWKSLININLPQHTFLKDHKIQDAILFPAVAYLELATATCHQLLLSKENEQQPTIIFEDVNFIKALILNEHESIEVFTQIIMPMREWYIIFCNQDNLNKYLLNEFTLHAQDKIEVDSKQQNH
ncbi:unnamed protein product [Adineta steineri]|uniref:Uncharacterized protein n=1 Tax=Adineta steineri TaxID=433720 RepID=A0A818WHN8_9BILA|nr:unnamed protein product [Adineta steineri]